MLRNLSNYAGEGYGLLDPSQVPVRVLKCRKQLENPDVPDDMSQCCDGDSSIFCARYPQQDIEERLDFLQARVKVFESIEIVIGEHCKQGVFGKTDFI